jgi:hypothetical protein
LKFNLTETLLKYYVEYLILTLFFLAWNTKNRKLDAYSKKSKHEFMLAF